MKGKNTVNTLIIFSNNTPTLIEITDNSITIDQLCHATTVRLTGRNLNLLHLCHTLHHTAPKFSNVL